MRPGLRVPVIRALKLLSSMAVSPRPLVLCGPSGSGKSTLLQELMKEFPNCFGFSISHTTRKPRAGEVSGREYHFVDRSTMLAGISREDFVESTEYSGNLYGTSKDSIKEVQKSGRICVLDIDVQGVKSLKKTDLSPKYVFVKPPSLAIMEKRLRDRATETEESLAKRLSVAKTEIAFADEPGNFDIIIVNENLQDAYQQLREFLIDDIKRIIQK